MNSMSVVLWLLAPALETAVLLAPTLGLPQSVGSGMLWLQHPTARTSTRHWGDRLLVVSCCLLSFAGGGSIEALTDSPSMVCGRYTCKTPGSCWVFLWMYADCRPSQTSGVSPGKDRGECSHSRQGRSSPASTLLGKWVGGSLTQ